MVGVDDRRVDGVMVVDIGGLVDVDVGRVAVVVVVVVDVGRVADGVMVVDIGGLVDVNVGGVAGLVVVDGDADVAWEVFGVVLKVVIDEGLVVVEDVGGEVEDVGDVGGVDEFSIFLELVDIDVS